jgi:hypothetical protein
MKLLPIKPAPPVTSRVFPSIVLSSDIWTHLKFQVENCHNE